MFWNEIFPVLLILVSALIVSSVLFFFSKRFILKLDLHSVAKESILQIIRAPLVVAIVGYGILLAVEYEESLHPGSVPYFAQPSTLTLILQLVILSVAVRTAGSIIKRVTPTLTGMKEADRLLIYSVYTLGLVALSYIVLTSPISPGVAQNVWAIINFLTGIFVTYLVVYIVNVVIKRYAQAIEGKEPRLQTTLTFIRRLLLAIIALIGVSAATFASFPTAGGLIASLFIAAGFSSIVIGLAAQSSLSNLIAGMVVSVAQPFKIGDAVVFKDEFCFVEDIKLMMTVLRTWDNRRLMVPNELFLSQVVTNYTAEDPTMLAPVFVQITYESDLDKAISILKDVARRHPDFLPIGDLPVVHVMEYNDSGMNLRLLSRAKDQPTAFQMEKDILYQIRKEFQANGIEIAYPRRQIVLAPNNLKAPIGNLSVNTESSRPRPLDPPTD